MFLISNDLEHLASEKLEFSPAAALASRRQQFQPASLEEILDLLEEAAEVYKALQSSLSLDLRQSAEQEIAFYISLVQERYSHRSRGPSKAHQVA